MVMSVIVLSQPAQLFQFDCLLSQVTVSRKGLGNASRRSRMRSRIQGEGRIDEFVQSVGTAASICGPGAGLRGDKSGIRIVAVEPAESPVLAGGPFGAHRIDGIGAGYVVPLWRADIADQIEPVSTDGARAMAVRLARKEGAVAAAPRPT